MSGASQLAFVFKPHNQVSTMKRDNDALEQLKSRPPQKTIACQRCRKLRKKCSKHAPHCVTCMRMGQECVYADDGGKSDTFIHRYQTTQPTSLSSAARTTAMAPTSTTPSLGGKSTSQQAPTTLLPPLSNNEWNYTHRSSSMARAPSLPSLSQIPHQQAQQSHDNNIRNVLPSIKLPSINPSTLADITMDHKPTRRTSMTGPTQIQSALLSTIISLGKDNLQSSERNPQPFMLPREVALKCMDHFFINCEPLYPFINKQRFMAKFESANLFNVLNPAASISERDKKICFQTYLMLAIGFHDLERLGPSNTGLSREEIRAHSWVFNSSSIAQWLIQGTLSLRAYEDIVCMVLLLMDSFNQRNCLATTNLTNITTGLILRYHYHRKMGPMEINKVYNDDTWALELRYRLFWTVYVLDRTVSIYLNKPLAIPEIMITTPLPLQTHHDPEHFSTAFTLLVQLKRLEGDIFQQVHSVTAINDSPAATNDANVLQHLRTRAEQWYLATTSLPKTPNVDPLWLTTMYYNALTLIYRPSYLVRHPSKELFSRLSRAVTQNLTYTYNLNKRGSTHWLALFRVLIVFKSLLRCFAQGSLKIGDSRTELSLCVEIIKSYRYGEDWAFLDEISLVFQRLLKLAFENVEEDVLLKESKYAEDRLETILVDNALGCRLDDRIEEEYGV